MAWLWHISDGGMKKLGLLLAGASNGIRTPSLQGLMKQKKSLTGV